MLLQAHTYQKSTNHVNETYLSSGIDDVVDPILELCSPREALKAGYGLPYGDGILLEIKSEDPS